MSYKSRFRGNGSVLSYHYSLLVGWLFAVIAVVWSIVAAIDNFQVCRWWEKVTYLVCCAIIVLLLIFTLLCDSGIINFWSSCASRILNVTLVAPQLSIIFALVKTNRPSLPMMIVPDDDFWNEVIDNE